MLRAQGELSRRTDTCPLMTSARAAGFDWLKADPRREFLRARIDENGMVVNYPNQSSGVLTSTHWAAGLIDNPPGQTIRMGDSVRFLPFSELLA